MTLAMADIKTIMDAVGAHANGTGEFDKFMGHEPKSAPEVSGIAGAVWWGRLYTDPARSGINSTALACTLTIRCFRSMLSTEAEDFIDPAVVAAAAKTMEAFSNGFELDGYVRAVDLLGMAGPRLEMDMGYIDMDGKIMRSADVTVPLLLEQEFSQHV